MLLPNFRPLSEFSGIVWTLPKICYRHNFHRFRNALASCERSHSQLNITRERNMSQERADDAKSTLQKRKRFVSPETCFLLICNSPTGVLEHFQYLPMFQYSMPIFGVQNFTLDQYLGSVNYNMDKNSKFWVHKSEKRKNRGIWWWSPKYWTQYLRVKVKVKLRFSAPSAGIAEIEQTFNRVRDPLLLLLLSIYFKLATYIAM